MKKRNCVEESRRMGLIVKEKCPKSGKKTELRERKPAHGAYAEEQMPEQLEKTAQLRGRKPAHAAYSEEKVFEKRKKRNCVEERKKASPWGL